MFKRLGEGEAIIKKEKSMMISKRKLALIALNGALVAASITAISMNTNKAFSVFPETDTASIVWKHYAAVAPTYTTHGSKEFWVSCGTGHTIVFNQSEVTGKTEEGGDISQTSYWADITENDPRYVATLVPKVAYDVRGGAEIASSGSDVAYGTKISDLPTTTRDADGYYDGYTFDGWYSDGVKLGNEATVTEDLNLKAGWKYGNAKKVYVNDWNAKDFTLGTGITQKQVKDCSGASDVVSDEEGFMFVPGNSTDENTVKIPAINFSEFLNDVPVIYMSMGGAKKDNYLHVTTANDTRTKLPQVGSDSATHLTQTKLWFTKDSSGNVHMHFIDTEMTNPMNYDGRVSRSGDLTLSDAQAKGEEGILFDAKDRYSNNRYYWLGRPYYFSGEGNCLDISTKTGYTVSGAAVKTKSEHTNEKSTGYTYWYEAVGNADQYVALVGSDTSAGAKLTFDAIKFSELFAVKKGLKFTIGGWNGNETFYFGDTAVGVNAANLQGTDEYKTEQIEKTFHNWIVTIDDIGAHVYNQNEDKTYDVALTAGQIAGTESISMTLGAVRASGRCFWLSDVTTFHF